MQLRPAWSSWMARDIDSAFLAVADAADRIADEAQAPPGVSSESVRDFVIAWIAFSAIIQMLGANIRFHVPKPGRGESKH